MSTNTDRHLVQLFIEDKVGLHDSKDMSAREGKFSQFCISHTDLEEIDNRNKVDGDSYIKKAYQTLFQALIGLSSSKENWSLIKMYYALYYGQRAALCYKNISFLRCRNIYTLKIAQGQAPLKRIGNKYRGDHIATINIYMDEFSSSDILLTQNIEDMSPLHWMLNKREWVNYKRREFIDGVGTSGCSCIKMSYDDQVVKTCLDEIPIMCFDPDFACITFPIKWFQLNIQKLDRNRLILNDVINYLTPIDRECPLLIEYLKHL